MGLRHALAKPASTIHDVVDSVVGLHSSDPVTVFLSFLARLEGFESDILTNAIYEDRTLVRMLGMRRTLFVVSPDTGRVMDAACARALVSAQVKRNATMLEDAGITENGRVWVEEASERTVRAVERSGGATAVELTREVPELATKVTMGEGTKWAGTVGMSTRILFLLATRGLIARGRPLGTWVSTQYRWEPITKWIPDGEKPLDTEDARHTLTRMWLSSFGPGTLTDLQWWTGWNNTTTRKALESVGAVEVTLEDGVGYLDPEDTVDTDAPDDWVALLPSLDSTVMGWKERSWYLGDRHGDLFDRNGNAGPTVWSNGEVVGGWGQNPDGTVLTRLTTKPDSTTTGMIETEAERYTEWLDGHVVIPRFPTPIERGLRSGGR